MAQTVSVWEFDIYVAGESPKSELTYNNLKALCEQYLGNKCVINVIDLVKNPKIAVEKQIMATPTIVRKKPSPERILIGDLTNIERVISKLDLKGIQLKCRGTMVSFEENPFAPSGIGSKFWDYNAEPVNFILNKL